MDIQTLGAALALAKKTVLPAATPSDAGEVLTVGPDGTWVAGQGTTASISVVDTGLVITGGE